MGDEHLTEKARAQIREIVIEINERQPLNRGQKFDAAKLIAAFFLGAVALLGTAGYFVVDNAAKVSASQAAATVRAEDAARVLKEDDNFKGDIRNGFGSVPAGAVMAFNVQRCPSGWRDFKKGAGRFIIGMGPSTAVGESPSPKTYGLVETGGTEAHILTVEEMPVHSHQLSIETHTLALGNGGSAVVIWAKIDPEQHGVGGETIKAGGAREHDNMPPFIALKFCEKG